MAKKAKTSPTKLTKSKRTKKRPNETERQLDETQRLAHIGSWSWDAKTKKITWSAETYSIHGRDPRLPPPTFEELPSLMMPESADRLIKAHKKILTSGTSIEFDLEIVRPDGQLHWVLNHVAAERNKSGKVVRLYGTTQDLTERRRMEEALRKSESAFRTLFEASPIATELLMNRKIVKVNPAMCRISGYSAEELEGQSIRIAYRDDEEFERVGKILFEQVAQNGVGLAEAHLKLKNGQDVEGLVSMSPLDPRDPAAGVVATVVDITERKRAEVLLDRSFHETQLRLQISQALAGKESEDQVLDVLIQQANIYPEAHISILTFNKVDGELIGILRRSESFASGITTVVPYGMRFPASQFTSINNYIIHEPFASEDIACDKRLDSSAREIIQKEGGTSFAAFPLAAGNEWLGIIIAVSKTRCYFDEEKQHLYKTLAEQGAVALRAARLRETIRDSQQRYQGLVETLSDWIWEVDQNLVYTYVSPKVQDLLGYDPEAVLGKTPFDFMPPEEAERVAGVVKSLLADQQPLVALENTNRHKAGYLVVFETSGMPFFDAEGRFKGYRGVDRDITARKQIEESLRERQETINAIIETSQDWIWAIDSQGMHTYSNPAIEKILGYRPEEIVGSSSFDLIHEDDKKRIECILQECEETRSGWNNLLLRWRHKNGTYRSLESNAVPILNAQGDLLGFRGVDRDITERKRAEEEKAKLEEQLRQAQKMEAVGRLAGGVAHDFNNMLAVIIGYTNLIKTQLAADEPLLKDIFEIERAATRSRDITSQLLAFSRKQTIKPKVVDLNDIIMRTQRTLARLIGEDIELKFCPGKDVWKVMFDPSQIEQILINLAANARDAMPDGGKLTIETANYYLDDLYCKQHLGSKPGHYAMLGMSDNGVGMDKETLAHVFEPFFTTKEFGKGTGLGLAMVYGIIKQNNGFINIYSEPTQGTTIKIYIPRSMEEEKPEPIDATPVNLLSGTVLLVEDDDTVRRMTNKMLKAIGCTVLSTASPQEALSMCATSEVHVDLVLTDVVMPLMNGKELKNKIEALRPGIKTIFMSGYSANVIAQRGILEEGVHLLQKPFTINELANKICEVLGKR